MSGIWTIILAAGASSRFNGIKALAEWNGQSLLHHAIQSAPDENKIAVVIGAHIKPLQDAIHNSAYVIINENWAEGMGSSIASGLSFVGRMSAEFALLLPVDQPLVTPAHLQGMADYALLKKCPVLTKDANIIGPPAVVPAYMFDSLKNLKGSGLKAALDHYEVFEGLNMLEDIDTPDDLDRLKRKYQTGDR